MQLLREILGCVVFLGTKTGHGFSVSGTGFLIAYREEDYDFHYVISAAHVLWPERRRSNDISPPSDGTMSIRFNRTGSDPYVESSKLTEWVFHSDKTVDLCACKLALEPGSYDESHSFLQFPSIANIPAHAVPHLGSEIFLLGAFVGRIGEKKNIPIARIGSIAALLDEPVPFGSPRNPAYLLETRSLGGISGSPVFLPIPEAVLFPMRNRKLRVEVTKDAQGREKTNLVMPYVLLGMVIGGHGGAYADDFISESDTDINVTDADFNAGISVAIPAVQILSFLEQPHVKAARIQEIEAMRKDSGYRETSARHRPKTQTPTEPKTDNPAGKEDFMRLLNAAATKKPQAD